MSDVRIWTVDEVNAIVPRLAGIFDRLDTLRQQIGKRANVIERLGEGATGQNDDEPDDDARARADGANAAAQDYQKEIEKIGELGGILKDLDLGVVDFPTNIDGARMNLCWQRGEERVVYFRAPGAGLNRRQRLL